MNQVKSHLQYSLHFKTIFHRLLALWCTVGNGDLLYANLWQNLFILLPCAISSRILFTLFSFLTDFPYSFFFILFSAVISILMHPAGGLYAKWGNNYKVVKCSQNNPVTLTSPTPSWTCKCTTLCVIHILVRLTPDSKGKPTRDEKHLVLGFFCSFFLTTLTLFWLCSCRTSQIQQPLGGKSITFAVVKSHSCTAEVCNLKTPTLAPHRTASSLWTTSADSFCFFSVVLYSCGIGLQLHRLCTAWIVWTTIIRL